MKSRNLLLRPIMMAVLSAACTGPVLASQDGSLDTSYGNQGRNVFGFLESDHIILRDMARYAPSARTWLVGDAADDPAALYLARIGTNGQPDATFGPSSDGRRRTVLPNTLVTQAEALQLDGMIIDSSGKPLIFGGLRPINAETGAYPALICRVVAAGSFDTSFDTDGCQTIRTFASANEQCSLTDAAETTDGDIVVIGNCVDEAIAERPFIARLNNNGGLDTEFAAGAGVATLPAPAANVFAQHYQALVVRPDGRPLVLGTFETAVNSIFDLDLGLIQLDAGGSIDTSFASSGFRVLSFDLGEDNHDRAIDVALRSDGRALVLGEARLFNTQEKRLLLAQTLADGSLDPSFDQDGMRVEDTDHRMSLNARASAISLDPQGRAVITSNEVSGQPDATEDRSTDFWFALPATVPPTFSTRVLISSDQATTGTISSSVLANPQPFSVSPGVPFVTDLPNSLNEISNLPNGGINNLTLHVEANAPVSVVPWSGRTFSIGTTLTLPTKSLGRDYRINNWGQGLGAGAQLTVVAANSDTLVTITPKLPAAGHPANVPFQITLQQGQRYDLRPDTTDTDFSGTLVRANKPVAVFAGHTCAQIPDDFDFCDAAYEQLRPMETGTGTEFVYVPSAHRPGGDVIRVLADRPDTTVYFNGQKVAALNAGEHFSALRSSPVLISTSQPAFAIQMSRSCIVDEANDICPGDPSQLSLEPVSRWANQYLATVPSNSSDTGFTHRVLTIIAPQSAVATLTMNGAPVGSANFTNIAGTALAYARIERPNANVDLISANAPIWVSVAGMIEAEMYAHGAAAMLPVGIPSASAKDLILRLRDNGQRDVGFGTNGVLTLDHSAALGGGQPAFAEPMQAIHDGTGLVIATAVRNGTSGQDLLMNYRVGSNNLFRDSFE